jgi:aspartyl-tRNA(Asn)/glutamyl-tRNA(Gln) amidotransferase subunit C
MEINDTTIDKLAELSRLEFNGLEREQIRQNLQNMIAFVNQLSEIDTTQVQPLVHVTDGYNVLRDDVAEVHVNKEEALSNAPLRDSDFFKIPKVVNK